MLELFIFTLFGPISMGDEPPISDLMTRLQVGDQQVADEIFHRFASRLVALARMRLDLDLRRKIDPEDIVQSVFRTFFRRQAAGEFEVANWDGLWALLAMITVHKAGYQIRYYRADRRDAGHEQSVFRWGDDSAADWEAVARDPTPSHVAMFTETVEELLKSLRDNEREILVLSLQGEPAAEVGRQLNCSERTVRRVLKRVRDELGERCETNS
jgi:RNA polymerase sigma-70 factor (ECF subfamily)